MIYIDCNLIILLGDTLKYTYRAFNNFYPSLWRIGQFKDQNSNFKNLNANLF